MFSVSEAEAAAIRAAFDQGGEFASRRHGQRRGAGVRAHHRRVEAAAGAGHTEIACEQEALRRVEGRHNAGFV